MWVYADGSLASPTPRRIERTHGREVLRVLLAAYLGLHPTEVAITRRCPLCNGPHGPPRVPGIHVSVSYTAGLVAYAVAAAPVGVDIELVRPDIAWRAVAHNVLPGLGILGLGRAPEHRRFFAAWVAHEALGKAVGVGIAVSPDGLEREARLRLGNWTITALEPTPRHLCAVALAGARARVLGPRWLIT